MHIIQASEKHYPEVKMLLQNCVMDMNSKDMFHWNSSYPAASTIQEDIKNKSLYICQDNEVCKGMIVLNESVSEEYRQVSWKTKSGKILVVHRLAVNPLFQGKGIGKKLMEFSIMRAKEKGYDAIWLDVIETNPKANKLYLGMGFQKTGTLHFPDQKTPFNCYEIRIKE